MTDPKKRLEKATLFARKNLLAYSIGMYEGFQIAEHHRIKSRALHEVLRGTIKRLIITEPPRHGKSLLATQLFSTFYLGHKPKDSIILASYGDDLATDFGRWIRNAMATPFYEHVFPNVKIAEDSNARSRFHTSQGGGLFAVGKGGALTGRGGNILLIDDLFKNRQDASSALNRKNVKEWYRSTLRTRLMKDGAIIIINTRWHQDDLVGSLLQDGKDDEGLAWHHINLPAINEKNEALWPAMFPIEALLQTKKEIGSFEFEALYQQNPTPQEGGIVKRNWIKFYKAIPPKFDMMFQSWDMAFKDTDNSDYVVGSVWGVIGANIYLLDIVRDRMDFLSTKNAFRTLTAKWPRALVKLVEDKANGPAIISELKNSIMGIKPINPQGSKQARLYATAPLFESGNVLLPDPSIAPWVNDYIEELVGFPGMKNDDQVDVTTQLLLEVKEYTSNSLTKLLTL